MFRLFSKKNIQEKQFLQLCNEINKTKTYKELTSVMKNYNIAEISEDKIQLIYKTFSRKYTKIDFNIFPYLIQYLYLSKEITEFQLAILLLKEAYQKLAFLPALEKITLTPQKFLTFLPTLIEIIQKCDNDISNCMYLILLQHIENNYSQISEQQKKAIIDTLYRIPKKRLLMETQTETIPQLSNSLSILIDVVKYFHTEEILKEVQNCIGISKESDLFAIQTLLYHNKAVARNVIENLAKDVQYTSRLYKILLSIQKQEYFPKEYLKQEWLAKSDLVNWLSYPTRLGNALGEIEFINTIEKDILLYYIFKFTTKKGKLMQNSWMIGISGGYEQRKIPTVEHTRFTFSKFEIYDEKNYKKQAIEIIERIKKVY